MFSGVKIANAILTPESVNVNPSIITETLSINDLLESIECLTRYIISRKRKNMNKLLEQINSKSKVGSIKDLVFPVSNTYNFVEKDKVIFINTGDIFEGKFLHHNYSPVKKLPGQAKKIIKQGDILFSEIRPKNKHFALVDFDSKDYVVSTKLIVLKVKESIDPKYAYIVLTADQNLIEFQNIAESRSGTFPQITFESIADYEVSIPDLPTQKKIASILGAYDEKIENNNKIIKNLEESAQTIFNEWFMNFKFPGYEKVKMVDSEMGEIPEGWVVGNIETICERLPSGKVFKENEVSISGKIPVYDQSSKGIIGYHNEEPAFNASLEKPILIFGDHTCRSQIVCEPFSLGPNTIPLGEKDNYNPIFSYFLTKGLIEQREYKRHWNELVSNNFIIPDVNLVDKFIKLVHPVMAQIIFNEKENISLKSHRDLLLSKLI